MIYQALSIIDNEYNDTVCVSDSINDIHVNINEYVNSNFNVADEVIDDCMIVISIWEKGTELGTATLDVSDFPYSLHELKQILSLHELEHILELPEGE